MTCNNLPAVILAVQQNNLTALEKLNENELNETDSEGRTAIHYVCALGNRELLNFLLNKGCSPHQVDNKGRTPVHYAAKRQIY